MQITTTPSFRRIDWTQTIPVRHRVLWPDKPPEFCHVIGDESAHHFGAFLANELVGVASVFPEDDSGRIRKFATLSEFQGRGIGAGLFDFVCRDLLDSSLGSLWCDARYSAMDFYLKVGMTVSGEKFFKSGVPHIRLSIPLR